MSDSTYASYNPLYNSNGGGEAGASPFHASNLRAIKSTKENPPVSANEGSTSLVNAFKNDIYDNVNIDVSPPDENEDGFCAFDDEKENKGNEGAAKKLKVDTDKNLKDDAMEFVNGITKKQWLWAGGITAGLLILRGGKK